MKTAAVVTAGLALVIFSAAPAAAQFESPQSPPKTWASAWLGGLIGPGTVSDGQSDMHWNFASSIAGGLGVHRQIGNTLSIGLDANYSPARYEMTPREGDGAALDGSGSILSALVSGRLRYSGGGSMFMYLTGGAGTIVYGMPTLERWDPDLALLTGAGLEYRLTSRQALFAEWDRYWTFHQREGVQDNTTRHNQLRIGVRTGW